MSIVVLISGSGTNLQAILDAGIPIKFVMSDNHNAYGLERAEKRNIPTLSQPKLGLLEKSITKLCIANKVNLIVLAGFMKLLSSEFVKRWEGKIINIHPSLLPKYKGLNTHKRVLKNKEKYSGCTVHFVTSKLDSGRIISQKN